MAGTPPGASTRGPPAEAESAPLLPGPCAATGEPRVRTPPRGVQQRSQAPPAAAPGLAAALSAALSAAAAATLRCLAESEQQTRVREGDLASLTYVINELLQLKEERGHLTDHQVELLDGWTVKRAELLRQKEWQHWVAPPEVAPTKKAS